MQITLDTDASMWYYIKADRRPYPEGYRSGHNEAVLKTVWAQVHMGSNPIPSAKVAAILVSELRRLYLPSYGI